LIDGFIVMAKKKDLTAEERARWIEYGKDWLRSQDPTLEEKELTAYVKQVLDICQNPELHGWKTAAANFQKRFDTRLGKTERRKNTRAIDPLRKRKIQNTVKNVHIDMSIAKEIIDMIGSKLKDDEKKFVKERVKIYQDDFQFNKPSDRHLFMQLVIEEVKYRRINEAYIENDDLTKADFESRRAAYTNLIKLQETLGITRKQRDAELEKGARSIAELSKTLIYKLNELADEERLQIEEELQFSDQRSKREPMNPPMAKVEMENILARSERADLSAEELIFTKQMQNQALEQDKALEEKKIVVNLPNSIRL